VNAPVLADDVALFLDYDGTLVPIAPTPEAVEVPPGLADLLERIGGRLGGAVALVSGRTVGRLDAMFEGWVAAVAGVHGLQRRSASGDLSEASLPREAIDDIRGSLAAFAASRPGVLLEDKGVALALHYRAAPGFEAECFAAVEALRGLHGDFLVLQRGKMVCELRPRGATKADAVAAFLDESPFRGRRPVFVGDDLTDEDTFRLVNERGGVSIRVGTDATTAARHRLDDVPAVLCWLAAFAGPRT